MKIDIFVNNAGITGMNAKVWDYPLDEWKKVIEVCLGGVYDWHDSFCVYYKNMRKKE